MELIAKVLGFAQEYLPVLVSIVGSFSLLASVTPNKTDDRIAQVILDIVNFLGMNINKAKNDKDA